MTLYFIIVESISKLIKSIKYTGYICAYLLVVFATPTFLQAQGETNNWYFGEQAGIRFNADGTVVTLQDGMLSSPEGCASISDRSGNLLFYTNGEVIFDRNHDVMANGMNIGGSLSSTQSAIIVPLPESNSIYYVFTVDATTLGIRGNGLNYSIVDMNLNGGNGAVTTKNVNLLEDCTEKLTAVISNCVDNSVWIVSFATEDGMPTALPNFNTFHAFLLDSAGISTSAITSTFNSLNISDDQGYIKFSIDGSKLASANVGSGLYLFDFDSDTGLFSNQEQIIITAPNTFSYGVEFSLSGRYLYVDTRNRYPPTFIETSSLLQFDLNTGDISSSQVVLDDRILFRSALQLGINGKIYRALSDNYFDGSPYLGVINNPDEPGLAADYRHNEIDLGAGLSYQGLPQFVTSFYNTLDLVENQTSTLNLCEGDTLRLEAQLIAGATYEWEKDGIPFPFDGNIYTIDSSMPTDTGTYRVTIIRPNAVECPVIGETNVTVSPLPEPTTIAMALCDVDDDEPLDGITSFNLNLINETAGLTYSFYLNEADRIAGNPIDMAEDFRNIEPFSQILLYNLVNENGCEAQGDLILTVQTVPELVVEELYSFCEGDSDFEILAPPGFDSYRWFRIEDGQETLIGTGSVLNVLDTGNYSLEAMLISNPGVNVTSCQRSSYFSVEFSEPATINDIRIVDNTDINSIEVIVTGQGDYEYSIDGSTYQDNNYLDNVPSGTITIFVRDKFGCGITEQTVEIDLPVSKNEFPKFFTPNGDGINELWNFVPSDANNDINIISIKVYNRYGKLLVELDPLGGGWDGRFNGQLQPPTDYWFKAMTADKKEVQGHFSLKY